MEYPLTNRVKTATVTTRSLNPCSNGIPSDTNTPTQLKKIIRLNPCSNGIPSDTMIQRALTFLLF